MHCFVNSGQQKNLELIALLFLVRTYLMLKLSFFFFFIFNPLIWAFSIVFVRRFAAHLEELEQLLKGIAMMKELTLRTKDYLVSFGECMSTRIFAAYLNKIGVKACQVCFWLLVYAWYSKQANFFYLKNKIKLAFKLKLNILRNTFWFSLGSFVSKRIRYAKS